MTLLSTDTQAVWVDIDDAHERALAVMRSLDQAIRRRDPKRISGAIDQLRQALQCLAADAAYVQDFGWEARR